MKSNTILGDQVHIFNGELKHDIDKANPNLLIHVMDEYVKSKSYQNIIREKKQFYVGGNILYELLTELFEYVIRLFGRIRLEDLNLNEGNKTLLFLKKFSSSSIIIEQKLAGLNSLNISTESELFLLHITGLENKIEFSRNSDGRSRLMIEIPVNYVFSRLISYLDKMDFSDINKIDKEIRVLFLNQFMQLNQKIKDHKKQIEMKYALELSQERARDLETQNALLLEKTGSIRNQGDLYKRSFFLLKDRYSTMFLQYKGTEDPDDADLEELYGPDE